MKENRSICKKGKFIDEVFGETVEYVRIYDENGITIIFGMDNQIIVKEFKISKMICIFIIFLSSRNFYDFFLSLNKSFSRNNCLQFFFI